MNMTVCLACICGSRKVVDTISDDGACTREGIQTFSVAEDEFITRCYCETCGLTYHPNSVGIDKYTTPTRINPQ